MATRNSSSEVPELAHGGRLSDLAYTRILETLFDRKIPAGAFVSQNDLVQLLGIPVGAAARCARVLETEGVLTIHPRSGIQFVKPGLELTRSTYQFRSIIERAAVAHLRRDRRRRGTRRSRTTAIAQAMADSTATGSPTEAQGRN